MKYRGRRDLSMLSDETLIDLDKNWNGQTYDYEYFHDNSLIELYLYEMDTEDCRREIKKRKLLI